MAQPTQATPQTAGRRPDVWERWAWIWPTILYALLLGGLIAFQHSRDAGRAFSLRAPALFLNLLSVSLALVFAIHIFGKLNVSGRTATVTLALEQGILHLNRSLIRERP